MDHLRIQCANHRPFEIKLPDEEGTGGYINDSPGARFVQRCMGSAVSPHVGTGTKGLAKRGAKSQKGVFGSVMVINCEKRATLAWIDMLATRSCKATAIIKKKQASFAHT